MRFIFVFVKNSFKNIKRVIVLINVLGKRGFFLSFEIVFSQKQMHNIPDTINLRSQFLHVAKL